MISENNLHDMMITIGKNAREVTHVLAVTKTDTKNRALSMMAEAIRNSVAKIQAANQNDVKAAKQQNTPESFIDRLILNEARIEAMAKGLEAIAQLPDPVGTIMATLQRPNGLIIKRVRVPLGVIGVIYESRPNVTADAAGLCLKAGNAVILRGGSDSFHSSAAIMQALRQALTQSGLPPAAVQM